MALFVAVGLALPPPQAFAQEAQAPAAKAADPAPATPAAATNPAPATPPAVSSPAAPATSSMAPAATSQTTLGPIRDADANPGIGPLPEELSPWGMFRNADIVVKAVIIGLAIASVVTWTVWLAKSIELRLARRAARAELRMLLSSRSLADAVKSMSGRRDVVPRLIDAAQTELRESPDLGHEGIKERLTWQLERLEMAAGRHVARGMSILATVGAVAPFVGLFGTVWGIMNSFVGISRAHTTNLAVVAPGIAEALLATAFGLAAAIPAVVIYNAFTRSIGGYRAVLADASVAVLRLVSRDLDRQRGAVPMSQAAE
jgi:biopolymer transport protein ExbB